MPRTPEQHSRDSRRGARIALINNPDWTARTATARAKGPASLEWHERKVDPENLLPPQQRRKVAEVARQVYYQDLADASARARAGRKAQA